MERQSERIIIHQKNAPGTCRWFTYGGSTYTLMYGGHGFGWTVYDQDDQLVDEYHTLRELRAGFLGSAAPVDWGAGFVVAGRIERPTPAL